MILEDPLVQRHFAGTGGGSASAVLADLPDLATAPLTWSPLAFAALLVCLTPGMHLALSWFVERRQVRWRDDYAAVLVGDPLLAAAGGLALASYSSAGPVSWTRSWPAALCAVGGGWAYGYLQSRHEVREGRYLRVQAVSPSKLWHQYVVYPVVGLLLSAAWISALLAERKEPVLLAVAVGCLIAWLATTVHGGPASQAWPWRLGLASPPSGAGDLAVRQAGPRRR